jgi:hypothetical protein
MKILLSMGRGVACYISIRPQKDVASNVSTKFDPRRTTRAGLILKARFVLTIGR